MLHSFYKGTAAMSVSFEPEGEWQLEEARLHLSSAGGATENYTITLDSVKGDEYDIVLSSNAMASDADVQYKPTRADAFVSGDKLLFQYANTNTRAWGLEITYSHI